MSTTRYEYINVASQVEEHPTQRVVYMQIAWPPACVGNSHVTINGVILDVVHVID